MKRNPLFIVMASAMCLAISTWAPHAGGAPPPPTPTPRETAGTGSITPQSVADPTARFREGDMAPDFELDGSQGRSVRLSSLRGDWVALVFSDRLETLPALAGIQSDLRKLGVRVVGVCREKATRVQGSSTRDLPILILADATGEVGSLYGLRNMNANTSPAFLLLNRRGVVTITVTGQEMSAEQIRDLTTARVKGA